MPGQFETPGSPRINSTRRQHSGSFVKPTDRTIHMISTFRRDEEGFNGLGSIKTDIYLTMGWVSFAASNTVLEYIEELLDNAWEKDRFFATSLR